MEKLRRRGKKSTTGHKIYTSQALEDTFVRRLSVISWEEDERSKIPEWRQLAMFGLRYLSIEKEGMAQWWEHSTATNIYGAGSIPRRSVICGLSMLVLYSTLSLSSKTNL